MDLETKPHQESYQRRCCMLQNTKQGRDKVFTDKIEKILVSLMCLEVKIQKARNN